MFKKKKGQGALEYLLLIGGAVLIAVIVIALLVSMGGQSRDTAQDQANKLQQATDTPQMAQIVSVVAEYDKCTPNGEATLTVNWNVLGDGGTHKLFVSDSSSQDLNITDLLYTNTGQDNEGHYLGKSDSTLPNNDLIKLNPQKTVVKDFNVGTVENCGDSYYVRIETTKNNQTVKSANYRFSWVD